MGKGGPGPGGGDKINSSSNLDFNGNTAYLDSNDPTTFNFTTQDHTFVATIRPDATGRYILSNQATAPDGGYQFALTGTPPVIRYVKIDVIILDSTVQVPLNEWSTVSVRVDMDTQVEFDRYSQTGVNTNEVTADTDNIPTSANDLWIAGNPLAGSGGKFDGEVRDVHVYDRVLTDSEIQQLRHQPGSIRKGLLAYWPIRGERYPELDLGPSGIGLAKGSGGNPNDAHGEMPRVCFETAATGGLL